MKLEYRVPNLATLESDADAIYRMIKASKLSKIHEELGLSYTAVFNSVYLHAKSGGLIVNGDDLGAVYAVSGGEIVGVASWVLSNGFHGANRILTVSNLIVAPSYRYRSAAHGLISVIREASRAAGLNHIVLSTTYSSEAFSESLDRKYERVATSYLIST